MVTMVAVIHFTFVLSAIGISFAERLTRDKPYPLKSGEFVGRAARVLGAAGPSLALHQQQPFGRTQPRVRQGG